jgi:hypothetical protein
LWLFIAYRGPSPGPLADHASLDRFIGPDLADGSAATG